MREAFEKISEEYNLENSTYSAIEKDAAEKEFHKAEDLYYNLKRTVDEGKIEVAKLKTMKATAKTIMET
jgi:hypothetical protein